MKKILITGASSGIGRTLAKKLIPYSQVWGVARRKEPLLALKKECGRNLFVSSVDISKESAWKKLVNNLKRSNFIPDIVIFNAGINDDDLKENIILEKTKKIMDTNFYGPLYGLRLFLPLVKPQTQFIAISSFSAFRRNFSPGLGYAASKSALTLAFESLHHKYKSKFIFKTIFFGPIKTPMTKFAKYPPLVKTADEAAEFIIKAIESTKSNYYFPRSVYYILSILRLMPMSLHEKIMLSVRQRYKDSSPLLPSHRIFRNF